MDQHHEPSISPTQGVGAPVSSATTTTATSKAPEFEPPQACVSRIIKNVLPENIQLTKEARAAFTRAAGVFIFYLTHCANEFSKENKRSTIYTQDVINALREIDFGEFEPAITEYIQQQRTEAANKKSNANAAKSNKRAAPGDDQNNTSSISNMNENEEEGDDAMDGDNNMRGEYEDMNE